MAKKTFEVEYTIVGRAVAFVEAESQEEAERMAKHYEVKDDEMLEFALDQVRSVTEAK